VSESAHRQSCVRVNALVDQGIASLVEALSNFPCLCTLSSCEGGAFVTFRFERPLREQALLLCWLSRQIVGLGDLTAEWGGRDSLMFTLRCHPASIISLCSKVESVLTDFHSLLCDSPGRESGSSQDSMNHPLKPEYHDQPASPFADRMLRAVQE
jgi:hypothetical protein